MEPLSAVANIAAVIGLLDLSCRAGKEIYSLISAIKHGPAEIENLKVELEEIEFLLLNLNRYCHHYRKQHPSAVQESNSAIGRIRDTLQGLQIEYRSIKGIITNFSIPRTGTRDKIRGMKEKVWLAVGGKLEASFKTLERYKSRLSSGLQILAGFNDLAIHDKIGNLAVQLSGLSSNTLPFAGGVNCSDTESTSSVDLLPSSPTPVSNFLRPSDHDTIKRLSQHDQSAGFWTEDEDMQSAVLPLMLLRPSIEGVLHLLISEAPGRNSLSSLESLWIADELKCLLAKCHESAASNLVQQPHCMRSRKREAQIVGHNPIGKVATATDKKVISTSCLLQESPTGKVSVRLQFTQDVQSGETTISTALFLLTPNPSITRDGVLISLSRHGSVQQPQIQRSMSLYAVVEANSPAFECVRLNDIHALRGLLKTRQINPSTRSIENESLLSLAARLLRFDICELLLNEGADPNNCRSDGASAIFDVRNAFWYRPTRYNLPKSFLTRFLRLFVRSGCDINSTALGGSALHFTIRQCVSGSEAIQEAEITTFVSLLICLGVDIEHRNADGLTPLLYNACTPGVNGVTVLKELLQWGADPQAKSLRGEGPLHLAIAFSLPTPSNNGLGLNSLRERLSVLLQAGCNPSLQDIQGHTPSDFALSSPRIWFQWCLAISKFRHLSMIEIITQEAPFGLDSKTATTEETTDLNQFQSVDNDLSTDWESCSDSCSESEDEQRERVGNHSSQTCSHPGHIFISWNGKFPWGINPSCTECGQWCNLLDIHRRKLAAWRIFQCMLAQHTTSINRK